MPFILSLVKVASNVVIFSFYAYLKISRNFCFHWQLDNSFHLMIIGVRVSRMLKLKVCTNFCFNKNHFKNSNEPIMCIILCRLLPFFFSFLYICCKKQCVTVSKMTTCIAVKKKKKRELLLHKVKIFTISQEIETIAIVLEWLMI